MTSTDHDFVSVREEAGRGEDYNKRRRKRFTLINQTIKKFRSSSKVNEPNPFENSISVNNTLVYTVY